MKTPIKDAGRRGGRRRFGLWSGPQSRTVAERSNYNILYVHWETGAGVTGKRWFRKVRGSCECGLGRAAEKLLFLEQEWQKRGLATDLFKTPC